MIVAYYIKLFLIGAERQRYFNVSSPSSLRDNHEVWNFTYHFIRGMFENFACLLARWHAKVKNWHAVWHAKLKSWHTVGTLAPQVENLTYLGTFIGRSKWEVGTRLARGHANHAGTHDTNGTQFSMLPYALWKCKCDHENYNQLLWYDDLSLLLDQRNVWVDVGYWTIFCVKGG